MGEVSPNRQKGQFEEIIDSLELDDLKKRFLRGRWLEQLLWFENKAALNQRRYYILRLVTIVGGLVVPALVSLNVRQNDVAETLAWTTFAVSLVVAISAALDGFFRFGDRWRTFRRTAEFLKAQGWQYFELSGPYAGTDHAGAFAVFAGHVENLIQEDVKAFITQVAPTRPAHARAPDQEVPDQPSSAPTG